MRAILLLTLAGLIIGGLWLRFRGMPAVAWDALATADEFELYSLEPKYLHQDLSHFDVLGKISITNPQDREKLRDALQSGVRESDGSMYRCFNPRHGIRVTKDGVATDFVICFECGQVEVLRDNQRIAYFPVTRSPQPTFDALLTAHGIPLPAKATDE
jgi:hypothetical protein